jgi:hypothetical protein
MIKSFLLWQRWRNTPHADLSEIHELIVLAARRCAYDLKHAADGIATTLYDKEDGVMFSERARYWLSIFTTNDQGKMYRHRLLIEINNAEQKIELYREFLENKGIEDPYPDHPF